MSGLLTFVLGATIKVSLIAALALVATALLRGRSAAVRHWVLAIAVACAAVTPILQGVVPAWTVAPLVDAGGVLATIQDAPTTAAVAATSSSDLIPRVARVAVVVWLSGVAMGFTILIVGLARLASLGARAAAVDDGPWRDIAANLSRAYGVRRPVRLLVSPNASLLATWGFLRPRIILPVSARDWSAALAPGTSSRTSGGATGSPRWPSKC